MGTTTNFQIPYPDGTDRPCDGAEQLNALCTGIHDAIAAQNERWHESWPTGRPMVCIAFAEDAGAETSGQNVVEPGNLVRFNTIEADNLQAADLITNNRIITLGATSATYGTYITGFEVTQILGQGYSQVITPSPAWPAMAADDDQFSVISDNSGINPIMAAQNLLRIQAKTTIALKLDLAEFVFARIYSARLWAVRMGGV